MMSNMPENIRKRLIAMKPTTPEINWIMAAAFG
jgi:hypothetical protein